MSAIKEFTGSKDRGGQAFQQLRLCRENAIVLVRGRVLREHLKGDEGFFRESRSCRQDEVKREVGTELGSFDLDVYEGAHGCREAERGQNRGRRVWRELREHLCSIPWKLLMP